MKSKTFTINCKPKDVVLLMTVSDGRLVTSLDLFGMVNDERIKTLTVKINKERNNNHE